MSDTLEKLSLKQQIYLETIYELSENHGHAHVKNIAERLNNRMPSVTEAMRKLSAIGLINYDVRKNVSLTEKGQRVASELDKRHSVLAEFYFKVLGCSRKKADDVACRVEHVVDSEFCDRLAEFASFIRNKAEQGEHNIIKEFQDTYQSEKQ
ncbi:metal-dependent transcriptional regulator [Lentisphaerota bacterium ZTH]|nr:metal-dependent transcriptional regulator [Lentisphaerota bacterium]WET06312.1 metal-dependent transcriptional regulator [Lentisphaerota bacterium ZTH]